MELNLTRKFFSEFSTIGELSVNGKFFCHILEDTDRGLSSDMSLKDIQKIKVDGLTCIPYGSYIVANTFSSRFLKYLPLLLNVPGYLGIRIHPGNVSTDTEGCLLPGVYDPTRPNFVKNSRLTFAKLHKLIKDVEKKEKITITITK